MILQARCGEQSWAGAREVLTVEPHCMHENPLAVTPVAPELSATHNPVLADSSGIDHSKFQVVPVAHMPQQITTSSVRVRHPQ